MGGPRAGSGAAHKWIGQRQRRCGRRLQGGVGPPFAMLIAGSPLAQSHAQKRDDNSGNVAPTTRQRIQAEPARLPVSDREQRSAALRCLSEPAPRSVRRSRAHASPSRMAQFERRLLRCGSADRRCTRCAHRGKGGDVIRPGARWRLPEERGARGFGPAQGSGFRGRTLCAAACHTSSRDSSS